MFSVAPLGRRPLPAPPSPQESSSALVREADEAVAVSEVAQGTPAWEAGMRRGMLVSHVDGQPVRTPKEFQKASAEKTGAVQLRLALVEQGNTVLLVPAGS